MSHPCRIHCFKIHRDTSGAPVLCCREDDAFDDYSDGLRVFKGSGKHPVIDSVPGVKLQPYEDHDLVMQKVQKLKDTLENFGTGEDTAAADLQADRVEALRTVAQDFTKYWDGYDGKVQELRAAEEPRARFDFQQLPRLHGSNLLRGDVVRWMEALDDSTAARTWGSGALAAPGRPQRAAKTAKALQLAVETQEQTFECRQEFVAMPRKVLQLFGTAGGQERDTVFDRRSISVGDIILVRMDPGEYGQDGRPWALGVALHPVTKDHAKEHKKGQVPAVYHDDEASPKP